MRSEVVEEDLLEGLSEGAGDVFLIEGEGFGTKTPTNSAFLGADWLD